MSPNRDFGLPYSLDDYREAPSGRGPLGYQWQDKPHRLVYDLVSALERVESTVDVCGTCKNRGGGIGRNGPLTYCPDCGLRPQSPRGGLT